jgi:hypothetical protein
MTIDRRAFVAGTALVVIAPAFGLLPAEAAPSVPSPNAPSVSRVVFMIVGWSAHDESTEDNQVWIRIGHSWRTAWR